jgi:hypothetical protein
MPVGDGKPWDPSRPFSPEHPKLVLVEGPDDWHAIVRASEALAIDAKMDVRCYEGITNLSEALETVRKTPYGYDQYVTDVAICRDAEDSYDGAVAAIKQSLANNGLPVPEGPCQFAAGEGTKRVSFYVWPNCQSSGCFEDLVLEGLAEDPAMPCVQQYHGCLAAKQESNELRLDNSSKVRLHALLASRPNATMRPGEAVAAYSWWQHPAWEHFLKYLRDL